MPTGWQRPTRERPGDVVVGVDGSEPSLRALDWTIRHTQDSGARIRVVAAVITRAYAEAAWLAEINHEEAIQKTTDALTTIVDQKRSGTAADIELTARIGHTGEVLVDESRHAQLLVVDSRGRVAAAHMLLGSAAHHAATHATCPVVIVS